MMHRSVEHLYLFDPILSREPEMKFCFFSENLYQTGIEKPNYQCLSSVSPLVSVSLICERILNRSFVWRLYHFFVVCHLVSEFWFSESLVTDFFKNRHNILLTISLACFICRVHFYQQQMDSFLNAFRTLIEYRVIVLILLTS